MDASFIVSFESHLMPFNGCLVYNGGKVRPDGSREIATPHGKGKVAVHRVAYAISHNIPLKSFGRVGHTCKVLECCKPEHLLLLNEPAPPTPKVPEKLVSRSEPNNQLTTWIDDISVSYINDADVRATLGCKGPRSQYMRELMCRTILRLASHQDDLKTFLELIPRHQESGLVQRGDNAVSYSMPELEISRIRLFCELHQVSLSDFQRVALSADLAGGL